MKRMRRKGFGKRVLGPTCHLFVRKVRTTRREEATTKRQLKTTCTEQLPVKTRLRILMSSDLLQVKRNGILSGYSKY
jgi:hypothetical protein